MDKLPWSVVLVAPIPSTAILFSKSERISDRVSLVIESVALLRVLTMAWMVASAFGRSGHQNER